MSDYALPTRNIIEATSTSSYGLTCTVTGFFYHSVCDLANAYTSLSCHSGYTTEVPVVSVSEFCVLTSSEIGKGLM
jgi:hypothetical protein